MYYFLLLLILLSLNYQAQCVDCMFVLTSVTLGWYWWRNTCTTCCLPTTVCYWSTYIRSLQGKTKHLHNSDLRFLLYINVSTLFMVLILSEHVEWAWGLSSFITYIVSLFSISSDISYNGIPIIYIYGHNFTVGSCVFSLNNAI